MGINPFGVLKALLIKQEGTTTPTSIQITPGGTAGTQTNIVGNQTTTRTLTLPDATDTLAGVAAAQTLTNKTFDSTSTATGIKMASFTPDGTNTVTVPAGAAATLATTAGVQTLSNKTLDNSNAVTIKDGSLTIQNTGDTTKVAQISASGLTTGTTRVYSLPDATTTLVGTGVTQTLTNKTFDSTSTATGIKMASFTPNGTNTLTAPTITDTLTTNTATQTLTNKTLDTTTTLTIKDSLLSIDNAADTTKVAKFDASGLTTATTRTYTLPDATTTLVGTAVAQSLSNKIMSYSAANDTSTGANVTLSAITSGIKRLTSGTLTSVSGIPAGSSGEILIVTNATGNSIVVNNNDTVNASAANVIFTGINSNIAIPNNGTMAFTYDGTSTHWEMISAPPLTTQNMVPPVSALAALAIDWSVSSTFTKTLSANSTFTFSNQVAGQVITVRLTNTASNYTVTWPTVRWTGGAAPVMSTGAVSDVYTFFYDGTSTYGAYVQNLS